MVLAATAPCVFETSSSFLCVFKKTDTVIIGQSCSCNYKPLALCIFRHCTSLHVRVQSSSFSVYPTCPQFDPKSNSFPSTCSLLLHVIAEEHLKCKSSLVSNASPVFPCHTRCLFPSPESISFSFIPFSLYLSLCDNSCE